MKAYPIQINGHETLVTHDNFTVTPVSDNITRELVLPHDSRQFMDTYNHTGLPTGSQYVFIKYTDGTILGTYRGKLITKLPRLNKVNDMLRKRGIDGF